MDLIKSEFLGVYSMPFLHMHLWYCGAVRCGATGEAKRESLRKTFFRSCPSVFRRGKKLFGKNKRETGSGVWDLGRRGGGEREGGEGRIRRINRSKDERGGGEEKGTRRTMTVTGILSRRGGKRKRRKAEKSRLPIYTTQKCRQCSYNKKLCFFSLTYHVDAGGDDEETHDHHEGAHDLKHRPGKYDANHHH